MKKKIILIQPRTGFWDNQRSAPAPPLALLAISVYLTKKYDIIILDQRILKDFYNELHKNLNKNTLFIGLTVFTGKMIQYALEISKYVKNNSDIPVVWGGVHPSILPEQTIRNEYIDYVLQGEGERTITELALALESDPLKLRHIPGLWYKRDGSIKHNKEREFSDLNELPMLPYHILDFEIYMQSWDGYSYISYQLSRGCPNNCFFCYNSVYNKGKIRIKLLDKAITEIKYLMAKYAFDGIFFIDDNIFSQKEYIMALAEKMRKLGLKWYVQGADIVSLENYSKEDFRFLCASGLTRINIGVESASPRIRNLINKKGEIDTLTEVISLTNDIPIKMWCNFIINFPTETASDLKKSVNLLFKLKKINKNVVNTPFLKFIPFYGTRLFEMTKNKFRVPKNLEEWSVYNMENINTPVFAEYLKNNTNFFKGLYIASLLNDSKVEDFSPNPLFKSLAKLYRPIAVFRLKHLFFKFNFEIFLFERFFNAFN
jgi:anaerobic magnesium-protoporphyrin IX monomethyl ester cyclase